MKLKYIGKGYAENEEDAVVIVEALHHQGLIVHHKPDDPKCFTIFENLEVKEE